MGGVPGISIMVLGIEEIRLITSVAGTDRNLFRTAISSNNPYVAELKDVIIFLSQTRSYPRQLRYQ